MKKVIAFLLALLLTGALILFCVSFISRQVILPAMNEGGAKVSDAVIREEQQLARERVAKLAELYGFDAEPVISTISEDTLRDLNGQASRWWSTLLKKGKAGDVLQWDTEELEKVLASDTALSRMEDQDRADYLRISAAEEVRNSITRMVLPMRQQTIRLGMQEVGKRVDLPSLISFFLGVPWAALALCALLAGLIALLESRKFSGSVIYIGSALGGAAIVLAALMILCVSAGILPMIREASAGLTIQYQSVISGAMIRAGILAAALAAGCILCLAGSRKNRKAA
jgi:hypothetical protein